MSQVGPYPNTPEALVTRLTLHRHPVQALGYGVLGALAAGGATEMTLMLYRGGEEIGTLERRLTDDERERIDAVLTEAEARILQEVRSALKVRPAPRDERRRALERAWRDGRD